MRGVDQQTPNAVLLTKCSKMTTSEDKQHKKHGMNGTADGPFAKEDPKNAYTQGGRLKFFKDGKFILELERAREGERVSWVSVPRKTFWPPQGTAASTPTYRQESSTSLSVSDDNSSVQSSPWQRDHSWKQTSPRRDQSKEMSFYFWCPKRRRRLGPTTSSKRRRPYSSGSCEPVDSPKSCRTPKDGPNTVPCNNKVNLLSIVRTLTEKRAAAGGTPPRAEAAVSPRKRFLREMEKDRTQPDDNGTANYCQKRSRNKTAVAVTTTTTTTTAATGKIGSPVRVAAASTNGTTEDASALNHSNNNNNSNNNDNSRPARNCSYSITSLLADDRAPRRSPNNSPSHYGAQQPPQYCSPTSEDRWFSESVDRLRSIELSQADKRTYPSYHHQHHQHHPPYMGQPFVYPYSMPPYYNPAPGMYGRYMVPPIYPTPPPPLPFPVRSEAPTCSWVTEPQRETADHRDDNITDMPLNLSKH